MYKKDSVCLKLVQCVFIIMHKFSHTCGCYMYVYMYTYVRLQHYITLLSN